MYNVEDIKELFRNMKSLGIKRGNTIELQGASFIADQPTIFGERNEDYIRAEIEWYESCDRSVDKLFNIYGRSVAIWDAVKDKDGNVNSNYGYCIHAKERGWQYLNCVEALRKDPNTRQAVMIYMPTNMHQIAGKDFTCTYSHQYFNNDGVLDVHVYMRSNDVIFGYNNDRAWALHVQEKLARDVNLIAGNIYWHCGSLHVYDRHWDLIK